jgi:pimeloyl-ACP methyl ester carboxylesterase
MSGVRAVRLLSGGLLAGLVCLLALGCASPIRVYRVGESPLLADWYASAVEDEELSPRTQQTLRQLDLWCRYRRQPREAFQALQELASRDRQPEYLFALAEMAHQLGRQAERWNEPVASAYYYLCAGYSYHYLFYTPSTAAAPGAACPRAGAEAPRAAVELPALVFDPRFRLACDLYNQGLSKCLRLAQRHGQLDPRQTIYLSTPQGQDIPLTVAHYGFAWQAEEFGPLRFCTDYRVLGLDNLYYRYGLGVPLIGTRRPLPQDAQAPWHYPRQVAFPVTAFFRFGSDLSELHACRAGRLELYNPLCLRQITVAGRPIPLESDLTTPLAYGLSHSGLDSKELVGFFWADALEDAQGIYFLEPYQRGKIPVLLIHGLLSSPLTWAPLLNDLQADAELRDHYQFWLYRYPTGNPYLLTAADLRQALARLRAALDPEHTDPALMQMVVIGHSMGGLIAKLLTQDSGEDFWHLVSSQPFSHLKADPQEREQIQQVFYFQAEPEIRRVIFLATPHHGSRLSPSPPARLLARLVHLPAQMRQLARDLNQQNPGLWTSGSHRLPTSLDLLSPGAPALELLAARSAPPGVCYHSIIGVVFGQAPQGSDGIVPYRSAHIEGVASELVVPADHTHVHHHPRAVLEVRRILHEHLQQTLRSNIIPAAHCPAQ